MANAMVSAAARSVSAMRSIGSAINNHVIAPAGRAVGALKRIGGGVAGLGMGLAQLGSLAVTVFGVNALKQAVNFEEQLAIINTIAHLQADELNNLGNTLQDVSQQYGLSIADMTGAQYEFLSTGIGLFKTLDDGILTVKLNTAQSGQALDAAAKLAVGGLSTMTEATQLLGFALNSYNLNVENIETASRDMDENLARRAGLWIYETTLVDGVEKTTRRLANTMGEASQVIGDQFAKAIEIGAVTAAQINSSFATVAASANFAGIGIDEISAAYATQTVRGLSARRTTVGMNRAITDLLKPGKALAELMERTGKNYRQIADTKGIHVALQEMRTDANRLGIAYEKLFLRQEGWRFALNITQDDLDATAGNFRLYERVLFEIQRSTGTSQKQVEERMDTVAMKVRQVKLAFQILSEQIGRPLLAPLRDFLSNLTEIIVGMYDWARANQSVIKQLAPIIGLTSAFIALTAGTQGLLFVLQPLAPMFGTTATNMRGLAVIVGRLTLPIGILVGLIGGFKFAVENGVRGFERLSGELAWMERLAREIVVVFQTVGKVFGQVWDAIGRGADVAGVAERGFDDIQRAVGNLGPAFERVAQFIARVFLSIADVIVQGLSKAIPAIIGWFGSVAQAIIPELGYLLGLFISWAQDVVPQIIDALGNFVSNFVTWVQQVGPPIANALLGLTEAFIDWAASIVPVVLDGLGNLAGQIGAWVGQTVPVIVNALASLAAAFANWFIDEAWPAVSRGLSSFLDNILEALQDSQFIRGVANAAVTLAAGFIGGLAALVGMIATWVAQNLDTIVGIFLEVAGQIVGGIVDFFADHGPDIAQAGVDLAGRMLGGMAEAIINDPTVIVRAILALATAAVVISAAITVGRAIAFAMWAPRYFVYMAELVVGNSLTGLHNAISGRLSGAVAAVGRAIAFGIFAAQYYGTLAITAIQLALSRALAAAGITRAAGLIGAAISSAIETAQLRAMIAGDSIKKALTRMLPSALTQSTIMGTAMGVAMMTAMAAAAVIGVLLVTSAIADGLNRQAAEINASVANIIEEGTTQQLETAIAAMEQGLQDMTFLGIPFQFTHERDDLENTLGAARKELERRKNEVKVPLTYGPPVPSETEQAAFAFVSDFNTRLQEGMNRTGFSLPPIDWPSILKEDTASQSLTEIRQKFDTTFADLKQSIIDGQASLEATVAGLGETEFKSDEQRLEGLATLRKTALAELAKAKKAGDTTAQIRITGVIGDIDEQVIALQNAKTLLAQAAADEATKLNESTTVIDTATEAQRVANEALERQLHERTTLVDRINAAPPIPPIKLPPSPLSRHRPEGDPPKPLTPTVVESVVEPYKNIRDGATAALGAIVPEAKKSSRDSMEGMRTGINEGSGRAVEAAVNAKNAIGAPLKNMNFIPAGVNIGATLAAGMWSSVPLVAAAAWALAQAASLPLVGSSPPPVGPLSNIDKDGRNIGVTWADGMSSSNNYAFMAAIGLAGGAAAGLNSTTAFLGGPQTIAPLAAGRGGGGYMDREALDRQTELLGEIAGATRLGAAASARSATRDPRAGGPLASRSTMQALKHLTVSRTRAGA